MFSAWKPSDIYFRLYTTTMVLGLYLHLFWFPALQWDLNYNAIDFITNALYRAFIMEKLTIAQVVKYYTVFFGKKTIITVFTIYGQWYEEDDFKTHWSHYFLITVILMLSSDVFLDRRWLPYFQFVRQQCCTCSLTFLWMLKDCSIYTYALGHRNNIRCRQLIIMFCWPCIIVYQYNETNVMHFSFSLLKIKSLYMFRALLDHPQEALKKRHLVYCVHVMSDGCTRTEVISNPILVQPTDITRTQYTKCRLFSTSWWWASNARNM
jgi:hypothetical protein